MSLNDQIDIRYNLSSINNSKFILHHHLGLGDHFVLNGMVNFVSKKYEKIYIPAKTHNYSTVKFMYENNNKVEVFEVGNLTEHKDVANFGKKEGLEILRVGFEKLKMNGEFNPKFYNQLDLSYDISFDYFDPNYVQENNKLLESHLKTYYKCSNNYIILHIEGSTISDIEGSLKIDSHLPKILIEKKSDIFKNLLYYLDVIKNAKEVHCINSSVFTLVERIPTNGKLFFHNLSKSDNTKKFTAFNKEWTFVDYS
jgi:hypothetical protein